MGQPVDTARTRRDWLVAGTLTLMVLAVGLRVAPLWSSDPDLGHGWIVGCFLLWWLADRWRVRPLAVPPEAAESAWIWIAAPVAVAVALAPARLLLTPYPNWPGLLWLWSGAWFALALAGLTLAGGRAWGRHFAFGAVLIATALPWPQVLQRAVFGPLRELLTMVAAEVLNWVGYPTLVYGTTLKVVGRWVGMEEACAGLRSLQLAVALAVMVGEVAHLRRRRRLGTIGLAIGLAIVGNFGRILFLSWRAARGAPVEDPLHDASGYLGYGLLAAALGLVCWRWRGAPRIAGPVAGPGRIGRAGLQWCLAAGLAVVALEVGAASWYAGQSGAWQPTWGVFLPNTAPYFAAIPLTSDVREALHPDQFAGASWINRDRLTRVVFYVEWRQGQTAAQAPFAHNPAVCFPYAGCRDARELRTLVVRVGDLAIPFHGYSFTRADQQIVAYYTVWDVDRQQELVDARPPAGWWAWWRARWVAVVARRSQIRAQLLTVALMGDAGRIELIDEPFLRAQIEAVLLANHAAPGPK